MPISLVRPIAFISYSVTCQVASAAGGMGFVLHLSLANGSDAEGWTKQEIAEYVQSFVAL